MKNLVKNSWKSTFHFEHITQTFLQIWWLLLYEIVAAHLGYKKMYARWVPKMFTDGHKANRMSAAHELLTQCDKYGDAFINHIVMWDETLVSYKIPQNNIQTLKWHHTKSPTNPKKENPNFKTQKVIAMVFGVKRVENKLRSLLWSSSTDLKCHLKHARWNAVGKKSCWSMTMPHASAWTQQELK